MHLLDDYLAPVGQISEPVIGVLHCRASRLVLVTETECSKLVIGTTSIIGKEDLKRSTTTLESTQNFGNHLGLQIRRRSNDVVFYNQELIETLFYSST